jgi:hypothetical protein
LWLAYRIQKHPERQHSGAAVDQVAKYGIFAPGFFFFTEHARQYTHNSGELENEENDCTDPPTHTFLLPPVFFILGILIPLFLIPRFRPVYPANANCLNPLNC